MEQILKRKGKNGTAKGLKKKNKFLATKSALPHSKILHNNFTK